MSAMRVITPAEDSLAVVTHDDTILAEEVLDIFRQRIVGTLALVKCMPQKDKILAVEFWNEVSERLQDLLYGEISIREDEGEDDTVKPKESEALSEQVVADGEETESEAETAEDGDETRDERRADHSANVVEEQLEEEGIDEVASESEGGGRVEGQEEVTMTVVEVDEDPKLLRSESAVVLSAVDATVETVQAAPAVEVTKIVSEGEEATESGGGEPDRTKSEQGESGLTTRAILTENSEGQQVCVLANVVELPSSITLDSDSKIVVNDGEGGLEGIVLTVDTDAHTAEVVEEEWLSHAEKVTVDEYPPMLDEKANRRVNKHDDGSHEVAYECDYCHKMFVTPAQLTAHRWHHTKPFWCNHCDMRFAAKGNLVVHLRRHTGERPYACKQCDMRFQTRGNVKRHMRSHTGEKPFECDVCSARFTEKKSLVNHRRKHTGERPYECDVCGKAFAQQSVLHTHRALHQPEKPHVCDVCGRAFRQKSQLRTHCTRHTGVRKFECEHCNARFFTKGDYERHARLHSGAGQFSCTLCATKVFTRHQALKDHMNKHFGRTPYQCKECGRAYSELSACHKHVRTHKVKPAVPASALIVVDRKQEAGDTAEEGALTAEVVACPGDGGDLSSEEKEGESKMEVIEEEEHELLEVVTEDGQKLRLEPGEQFIPGEQYILVETTTGDEEDSAAAVVCGGEPALSISAADQIIVPHGAGVAEDGTEIAYEVVEVGEECAVTDVTAPEA